MDSDIRITDISVSRFHSKLKIVDNQFYIEDNSSKFGTMLKIDSDFSILPDKQLALQIGKYFATFNVKKTVCAYFSCYSYSFFYLGLSIIISKTTMIILIQDLSKEKGQLKI